MRKKTVLAVLACCVAVLAVVGAVLYCAVYRPFDVVGADVEINALSTDEELQSCVKQFNNDSSRGYIDYMRKGFEFDLTGAEEYCIAAVTVKVYNPSNLTTSALYMFPEKDNDVICYLEPYMKAVSLAPGETKEVCSRFVCRRNKMTDEELAEYIKALDFRLLEEDTIFGKKNIKVSLKDYA